MRLPAAGRQSSISDYFQSDTTTSRPATVIKQEQANSNDTGYDSSPSSPGDVFNMESQSKDSSNSRVKVEVFDASKAPSTSIQSTRHTGLPKHVHKNSDTPPSASTLQNVAHSSRNNTIPARTNSATIPARTDSATKPGRTNGAMIPYTNGITYSSVNGGTTYTLSDSDDDVSVIREDNSHSNQASSSNKRKRPTQG